ncbi:MAG: hypothetical protein ACTSWN_13050 [Promethearchaeota archaeon]
MKRLTIKIDYEEDFIYSAKKDLDFIIEEFFEFFGFKKTISRHDKKHADLLYGELIDRFLKSKGPMKNYIQFRLNQIDREFSFVLK